MINNNKGYTLLELCIVLAVSGIISLTAVQIIKTDVTFKSNYLEQQFKRQELLFKIMDFQGLMMEADDFQVNGNVLTVIYRNPDVVTYLFFFDNYVYKDGTPYLACKRFEVTSVGSTFFVAIDLIMPNGDLLPIKIKGGERSR